MRTLTLVYCVLFLSSVAEAQMDCKKFSSYQDILQCAEERAPEARKAQLEAEQARARIGAAGQWRNPEVTVDSVSGTVGGQKQGETEFALGIPLELSGQISSRRAIAEGGAALADLRFTMAKANARADALLKLHRLRQLTHEREVIEESIATFAKLISQYAQRKGRSPEQEISASVFRMAKSEYDLKKAEIQDELAGLDSYFGVALGKRVDEILAFLPPSPKAWPKVAESFVPGTSPAFLAAQAELNSAEAELSLANSEAWPTLTVGPVMKILKEGGESKNLYGFNVSLPIPFFSLNGGNKDAATAGVKVSAAAKNIASATEDSARRELVKVYQQSVTVLTSSLSHQEIEKKHSDIERLFLRGILPSSLVIEAHRTFVELEKARNDRELKAVAALAGIYAMDGKKLELP